MNIIFIMDDEKEKLEISGGTIKELLQNKNIPLETVVVKRNKEIVIEEESIEDGDTIEVIRVIYGG